MSLRQDILGDAFGLACGMDLSFDQAENIANTFLGRVDESLTDKQELLEYAKSDKESLRMAYVYGYDESWFDLWWDNVGFDNIERYDDELEDWVLL